ncbi:SusD/RagB family nutrient-binding outer membrane lipoprotein [Danxiaibacter flavus]|uniref:SusD/RagB family nutrient-binding outer membrane lipoprotein n=1 Tax=Danxiaibacter flavus TaxID=3049108 RepID=A0ABV3ZDY8_9BACT|nr:SusD/RagB family nutrient-binding outer membrane lipoprotein [Chitinophagaceae bacterium DXS]
MNSSKRIFAYILAGTFFASSCTKDFQELNTTHDKPTSTTVQPLVNQVISTLFLRGQEQASIHNDYYYVATQLGATTSVSGYVLSNGVNDIWNDYYSTLQNLNLGIDKTNEVDDKETMNNIKAVLYILRAYKTFRVTDQFGDIPYFNAGKAYAGNVANFRVGYDPQQQIYDSLLNDLSWAVNNINTNADAVSSGGNPYIVLGSFDTFFKGDMSKWLEFGNSLRLRYAMQMVEKDQAKATPVIQDALTKPLIADGEDVGMWPASLGGYDLWVRWWSFSSGGAGFVRMSSTMWNMVSDGTTDESIFDPRAKLFVEPNQAGKWAPYVIGKSSGDNVNAYFSGTDPSQKNDCLFSPFNWYLVRDEWYLPEVIFAASEVHFLKAEAYARGLGAAQNINDAQTEYKAGITSSVNFWYNMVKGANNVSGLTWASAAPPPPTSAQMDALFANKKVAFTGAAADAVTKIYAQEWLSYFRQPWLAYNLWRRTGNTPVDPNSAPSATYKTFYRLPYAQDEAVNNADNYNAQISKMGGNNSDIKVWWMK